MTVAILLPGSCPQQVPAGSVLPAVGRALRPPIHSFPGGGSTRISANQDGGAGRPGHAGSGSPWRVLRTGWGGGADGGSDSGSYTLTHTHSPVPRAQTHARTHAHMAAYTQSLYTLSLPTHPHSHTITQAQTQARAPRRSPPSAVTCVPNTTRPSKL